MIIWKGLLSVDSFIWKSKSFFDETFWYFNIKSCISRQELSSQKKITLLPFLRKGKTNIQTNLKITSLDKNDNHFFSSEMMIPSQEKDSMFITNIILIVKQFWQNFRRLEKFQIYLVKVYISTFQESRLLCYTGLYHAIFKLGF